MKAQIMSVLSLILLYNILIFPLKVNADISTSSYPDDDLYDSPDIEIDDSLTNEAYDTDSDVSVRKSASHSKDFYSDRIEDAPDIYSNDVGTKKSNKSLPPLKKDEVCMPEEMSDFCQCQRNCYPDSLAFISPCQCQRSSQISPLNSVNYESQQPPLLASQPRIENSASFLPSTISFSDCSNGQNSPECSCHRACVPGIPINYNPCTCMEYGSNTAAPESTDFSAFNPFPQIDFANNIAQTPAFQPDYNVYNNQYMANTPHFDENSCSRACFPYTLQQNSPCLCNFNLKAENTMSPFAPSMYPTGYDTGYPSNYQYWSKPIQKQSLTSAAHQRTSMNGMLNSRVPKKAIGTYLGCFHDKKKTGRDLKMSIPVPKLTPDSCVNKCREKKKRFAATQNGYLCFCGSRFGRYNRTKDEQCGTPCSGDPTKYCGGHWLNAVYSTDGQIYSPKQFSFKTKDPLDESEYNKKIKNQANTRQKLTKTSNREGKLTKIKPSPDKINEYSKKVSHKSLKNTKLGGHQNQPTLKGFFK
ncbi:hypothetical protein HZS_1670 [Henneguya salminicola]|nr:hypothetical protein HZS_1670 [Henneguya salminicola]